MRERILVVDDQEDVRDYLYYTLVALEKYDVLAAESGAEGLKIIENERIDLIVTDLQMPGMTGLEMLSILKERDQQIPSILATGQGTEETAVFAFHLGILDYLIKPIEPDVLEASVEKALHATRLERERIDLLQELLQNNNNLQQRAREFNVLYGVGQTINTSNELKTIYHRVVDGAVFAVDADEGGLVLWDELTSTLCVCAIKEKNQEAHTVTQLTESKLVERAYRTAQPVLVHKELQSTTSERTISPESSLHVPILSRGLPVGVLYVTSSQPDASLDYADTQILVALADYVALAIRHAELHKLLAAETDGLSEWKALEDEIGNLSQSNWD